MTIRRAAKRLRELGLVPVLFAALLLAASSSWAAGHSGGGHSGGGHSGGGHSSGHSGGGHAAAHSPGSSHGSMHGGHGPIGSGAGTHHGNGGFHNNGGSHGNGGFHSNGGFHGHDGHGHGGFHGRGFYPGFGIDFGYWPGFSFGLGWGWGWDGWGWRYPYGYPYGYGPYGEGAYGGYGYDHSYSRDDMGALDLDISPGDTEVYVNGEKLGTVDDFDGWPQYLWLPKGTYDIVFYREGYKTLARQVSVHPGLVIDMDDRLEHGQSVLPQDLQTKTHERRDDRLRYEHERSDRIDRGQWDPRSRDDDNWRDRAHRGHDRHDQNGQNGQNADRGDDSNGRAAGSSSGWLRLNVDPEDSSVYLDGRFVGTGSELGSLQNGLKVDPGKHHLAVVRPGRKSVERDFDVTAGQDVKLSIDLVNGR